MAGPAPTVSPSGAGPADGPGHPPASGSKADPAPSIEDVARELGEEAAAVRTELTEIELLINQAKTEASRHESRRAAAAEKLAAAGSGQGEIAALADQVVAVARKAALMEAQVDLLEGKRKSISRLLDALTLEQARIAALGPPSRGRGPADGGAVDPGEAPRTGGEPALRTLSGVATDDDVPAGVARLVHAAQEDLRREIARAMHDGPAQSLTNIVLQAQIVERLVARDPAAATVEVHALTAMVQRTLDATKTFIFDVRPMVLDDLGLVPTLRRACRDRGTRAGVHVEFESVGVDRRLPPDLESGLFRMLDEALAVHLAGHPARVALRLDWAAALVIDLTAGGPVVEVATPDLPPEGTELPPALATMVEERRATYAAELEAARVASLARLPERLWRGIEERSTLLGITAELLDDGARLRLTAPLPES